MLVLGPIIGATFFYFQAGPVFPLIAGTPVWKLLLVMLAGCTLLPLPVSMDIRGWDEMQPLDGPAWGGLPPHPAAVDRQDGACDIVARTAA